MRHANDGRLVFSPSDLCIFLESRFASWMDRYHLEHPGELTPDPKSAEMELVARKGTAHENDFAAKLARERGALVEIERGELAAAATLAAMRDGAGVIFQGALARAPFAGYSDFLVRVPGASLLGDHHYEVWDTKLAHHAKPYFLVQLCCYAEMLEAIQGRRPASVSVVLGTGEIQAFRTDDYFFYYRSLKHAFLRFMDAFDASARPLPDLGGEHRRWQSHADAYLERTDHVLRVADIRIGQVKRLAESGIATMRALADAPDAARPRHLAEPVFQRLRAQARLQRDSAGLERPRYEVLPHDTGAGVAPRGLSLLPPESPLDVFFDIEGDPLIAGGLEYLFGVSYRESGERHYRDWWAHDRAEERRAFESLVDWLFARWQADPAIHVYHYAPYEVTALRKLMGRFGTREDQVDALLRGHVFVDLYAIVRHGVRVGEPGYSLKNLERLYSYSARRTGDVTTAGGSIVFYERWLERGEPRDWQRSPILRQIRDYNRDDCDSTLAFTDWLRERQREAGLTWADPRKRAAAASGAASESEGGEVERPVSETALRRRALAERLAARAEERRESQPDDAAIDSLLAHVVEFHRREDKPVWWALFGRRGRSHEDLEEDPQCLGNLKRTEAAPERVKRSTGYTYTFDGSQDTKVSEGGKCRFAHDVEVETEVERLDAEKGEARLKLGLTARAALGGDPPERVSLIPFELVRAPPIDGAVEDLARAWLERGELRPVLRDFLLRLPPRIHGHARGAALLAPDEDAIAGAIRVVHAMDQTCLCIQGPPGSGKSTTAARVILSLIAAGKRVGVASNSHKAILNLLAKCMREHGGDLKCLKAGKEDDDPFYERFPTVRVADNGKIAELLADYALVGGTAWLFARPDMAGTLDHLFVDEAGQVCVANLVAMSRAAPNLVLIGDQMQLGQPIQGSHPGESGLSALAYLLRDHPTIAPELGLFLAKTWRLHPAICDFISGAVYEDRLKPAEGTEQRVVRVPPARSGSAEAGGDGPRPEVRNDDVGAGPVPARVARPRVTVEAGLLFVPVEHEGNTQSSDEEAEVIAELIEELRGRERTDRAGAVAGTVGVDDILVVAPYNMQVRNLAKRLPAGVRVGSVDKFQGQEAAIVIVSMCASEGRSSPRGLEFLFDRNRLNVAISRAQSLAIVVGHPALACTPCGSVEQMRLVNLFSRIVGG